MFKTVKFVVEVLEFEELLIEEIVELAVAVKFVVELVVKFEVEFVELLE